MLERIGEAPQRPCLHREHTPPQHIVLRPGRYRHTCPGCGHVTEFTVTGVVHRSREWRWRKRVPARRHSWGR